MVSSDLKKNDMTQFLQDVQALFAPYKNRFEEVLTRYSKSNEFGVVEELKKASEYALVSGGKRFRPAIVWMMGDALAQQPRDVLDGAAFAVEYFHTASLIADDLPCMDNDDFRRGVPTTHKAFSEATAVLTSFSLIALGFQAIARITDNTAPEVNRQAILEASRTMGAYGLLGGQCIDMNPPDSSIQTIEQIMDMKTGALFDLSFTLGWLFGGGDLTKLNEVHTMANDFGRAFQILDDLDDLDQDRSAKKMINFALQFGVDAAISAIDRHVAHAIHGMTSLGLYKNLQEEKKPLVLLTKLLSRQAHYFASHS